MRNLTRRNIELSTVSAAKMVTPDVSYIRITEFSGTTADQLERAMRQSKTAKAFIIDLRNNPGGDLDGATTSAELFVRQGRLMLEHERQGGTPANPLYARSEWMVDPHERYKVTTMSSAPGKHKVEDREKRYPYLLADRPVIVLTNRLTASGGAVLTGALRDTAHAITVGDRTYGKGIGQVIVPGFAHGYGLRVTTFRYETPAGMWPGDAHRHRIGLSPDVPVSNGKDTLFLSDEDAQFHTALQLAREKISASTQHRRQ